MEIVIDISSSMLFIPSVLCEYSCTLNPANRVGISFWGGQPLKHWINSREFRVFLETRDVGLTFIVFINSTGGLTAEYAKTNQHQFWTHVKRSYVADCLTVLVPSWFIITSLVFFYLSELFFRQGKGTFVPGREEQEWLQTQISTKSRCRTWKENSLYLE